jgi:hypothetical protein
VRHDEEQFPEEEVAGSIGKEKNSNCEDVSRGRERSTDLINSFHELEDLPGNYRTTAKATRCRCRVYSQHAFRMQAPIDVATTGPLTRASTGSLLA